MKESGGEMHSKSWDSGGQDILILEYAKATWSFVVSHFPEYKGMGRFLDCQTSELR